MLKIRFSLSIVILLIISSCASYKAQYNTSKTLTIDLSSKQIQHRFYLIGDAGYSNLNDTAPALKVVKQLLSKEKEKSTAIFLGDNLYPIGMPKKDDPTRKLAEHRLKVQTGIVEKFNGKTIFIPGNHDWYHHVKGLKRQENFIEAQLGKNTFLPENGCPLKKVKISNEISLIIVDSEWYLTDWNKNPTINDDCEIKTRTKFFEELEGLIKKERGKTTVLAIHHPMYTNGSHGGQYSLKQQIYPLGKGIPLPIIGTALNLFRKTSGVSKADLQNKKYNELRKRIITLAQENSKVIFVSGHEHNLQYIEKDNIKQIISGSGSKTSAARINNGGLFSYGNLGFSVLDVFTDGSSVVRFYGIENNKEKLLFETQVHKSEEKVAKIYPNQFSSEKEASIYTSAETTKGKGYKYLWGDRYRKYYSKNVIAKTVNLDTLFGGLKPVRKGGGHQSKSLRLETKDGKEYVMRALRKSALNYLQSVAFKDQFIEGQFDDTYTEGLLMDVFTAAHPYVPFTIATLADAAGIYHTNPVLYYIPKQHSLGNFNDEFGDELYMIEERAASGHGDLKSFGFANKVISTDDLLKNIQKNDKYYVDEKAYIRARLFDMLIGDWDRHEDQWRWAAFKDKDKNTFYRPIPRDRDQAFSKMADGFLMGAATRLVPDLRLMQSYDNSIRSVKWFNLEPYPLDMALLTNLEKIDWQEQAQFIQTNLTDEVINEAFEFIPNEVNDKTITTIKSQLKNRRANLKEISNAYYKHISKYAVIKGTAKDDYFDIKRLPNGITKISAYRIIDGVKSRLFHEKTYRKNETAEIWIYGLDDKDVFKISGTGDNYIKIRLIGGQNKDIYNIKNNKRVVIYDYKSKKNEFVGKVNTKLRDDYETNVYDYKKLKYSRNQLLPTIGSNKDDGLKIGFLNTYTLFGFERNPFTSQHKISAAYYFATEGYEFGYEGEFANVFNKWNLALEAAYTSPNYSHNFFGYGNNTVNNDANYGLDYNRVKIHKLNLSPSLVWHGELGASFRIGLKYESNEVEKTAGRFINAIDPTYAGFFERQNYIGASAKYHFENYDNKAFPTLGMSTSFEVGYKSNIDSNKSFSYLIPEISFNYKLVPNGRLVLATKLKGHLNFNDGYQFYQAASIGANDGLRGYRFQRFTGKNSFYQNTDVRLNLRKLKTGILPMNVGIYGGFDYGRVWSDFDTNNTWKTSYGGGIWMNAADMLSARLSLFNSDDGARLSFGLGFGF